MKHRVIGIDLGTTYSAVATFDDDSDQAEIIKNIFDGGELTTPSVVSKDPASGRALVGKQAKQNLPYDPGNTIIEIKREMGEIFRPERPAAEAGYCFKADKAYQRPFLGGCRLPQEISALILMRLKEVAEAEIGGEIYDAVVTVPAYFTENQRRATEQAALLAGLYPRQLIPEPTAAAICFGVDRGTATEQVFLVYDLGGGTFDVSIITVRGDKIDVIASSGDPRLGGGDFDDWITEWAIAQLRTEHGLDVGQDPAARARIKVEAEQAKIRLSTYEQTELALAPLRPATPPNVILTRLKFEEMIAPLLAKSLTSVVDALTQATEKGVKSTDLDGVLLVGGSTAIPAVQELLRGHFERDEGFVRQDLDPAGVVARGAALLARRFSPSPPPFDIRRSPDASLVNRDAEEELPIGFIAEHTMGVGVQDGLFRPLIRRGTKIPISVDRDDFTNPPFAPHVIAPIYQGESEYVYDNTLIGSLLIEPIEPAPEGTHKFKVSFALDDSGLLAVNVIHLNTGRNFPATFDHASSVGGIDALAAMRDRLLEDLYLPAGAAPFEVGAATAFPTPVPAVVDLPPAPGAAEAASDIVAGTDAGTPSPPAPTPAQTAAAIVEPQAEVPIEFKSGVRRAHKLLLQHEDPALMEAFNAFATALNEGRVEDELTDLYDTLEDTYHDARGRLS